MKIIWRVSIKGRYTLIYDDIQGYLAKILRILFIYLVTSLLLSPGRNDLVLVIKFIY